MGERYMMFEQYMKEYVQEHADEIREEAREETIVRLNRLYSCLLASDRASDLQRALEEPEYLEKLLQEFGF